MAIEHELKGSMTLSAIWWQERPAVTLWLDEIQLWQGEFEDDLTIPWDAVVLPGPHRLCVEFTNKKDSDNDPTTGKDKAVMLKNLEFFGIGDPRFIWSGTYRPVYPEPWCRQQSVAPSTTLTNQDRLSWNGQWQLDFTVPIFTWMHEKLDLGWIYD